MAYYPFKGNANDSTINNRHMGVYGASLVSSRYGQANHAFHFDGLNDLITFTDTLPLSGNCTWSFWASIDTFQNSALIYNGNTNSSGYGFAINSGLNPSQGSFGDKITFFSGGINYNISIPFQANEFYTWHHFVLTKNGNKFKLYIDNVLRDSSTSIFFPANGKFHLGLDYTNNTNAFRGKIDDITLYNRVVTTAEIDTLFRGCGPQITTPPTNLSVISGNSAQLTVVGDFSAQTTFQWQQNTGFGFINLANSTVFSGVNNDTLTISNVASTLNNNDFRVIVTNDIGCKDTSMGAKLLVTPNSVSTVGSQQLISVYPNPSTGHFRITASAILQDQRFSLLITNPLGQVMLQKSLTSIQLADFSFSLRTSGVYFLTLFDGHNHPISRRKLLVD
jgi:hypothetical protein